MTGEKGKEPSSQGRSKEVTKTKRDQADTRIWDEALRPRRQRTSRLFAESDGESNLKEGSDDNYIGESDEMSTDGDEGEVEEEVEDKTDLTSNKVILKYTKAGKIVHEAMKLLILELKPDAKIVEICKKGDLLLTEQGRKFYKKSMKGVAFPACISINHKICNVCPTSKDSSVLAANDLVKINMSYHIEGYVAEMAHTHVITDQLITGKAADVICAAKAVKDSIKLRAGISRRDVNEVAQHVAAAFNCTFLKRFICRELKPFQIDENENDDENGVFELNKVYVFDIVTSTGKGTPNELGKEHTTIFRIKNNNNHLHGAVLRDFDIIRNKFPSAMPFSSREMEGEDINLMACLDHNILQPYPVLCEEAGDLVAEIKFTVLLTAKGTKIIMYPCLQKFQIDGPDREFLANKNIKCVKGKGNKKYNVDLVYGGKLILGVEGSGDVPIVNDIAWTSIKDNEILACACSSGVWLFRHKDLFSPKNTNQDLEYGWRKEALWESTKRRCVLCKWNPSNKKIIAIGCINEFDEGEVYLMDITKIKVEADHKRNYVGMGCTGLTSLSWSKRGGYLLVTGKHTLSFRVMKNVGDMTRCTQKCEISKDKIDLFGVFHPIDVLIFVATSAGDIQLYHRNANQAPGAPDWSYMSHWSYDLGFSGISINNGGDKLACTRSDQAVIILMFTPREERQPKMDQLYILKQNPPSHVSVSWAKEGDFLATMDPKQLIALYPFEDIGSFPAVCNNLDHVDCTKKLGQLDTMAWHKSNIIASAGADGFVLFWTLRTGPETAFVPKIRDLLQEKLYHKKMRLPPPSKEVLLKGFEDLGSAVNTFIAQREVLDAHVEKTKSIASSGLKKLYRGQHMSQQEMKEVLEKVLETLTTEDNE